MHLERLGVALLLSFVASACSSGSDFQVASDTGATDDAATTDSLVTGDVDADTATDPCANEPGKAKFCVTVTAEAGPGYAAGAASTLGIDGKGLLKVYLYDKDPGTNSATTPVVPVATLRYGAIGEKIAIDKLPVTLVDTVAKPGTYWAIGVFGDADRPESDTQARAGDFVSVPTAFDGKAKALWPKLELSAGKTTRQELKLYPMRRLDLEVRVATDVSNAIRDGKFLANGDGPVVVLLYDGVFGEVSQVLRWAEVLPCAATYPKDPLAKPVKVSVVTPIVGPHNLFVGLVDYAGADFPARGTFVCDGGASPPKVDLKPTDWIATAPARLTSILDPYYPTDPVVDTLTCK